MSAPDTSYRGLLRVAVPLILGMAANSAMQFIDRLYLARVGMDALAASFPVGMAQWTWQCFFIAAAAYCSTFAAQHVGAGEEREAGPMAWPALGAAAIAGVGALLAIPAMPAIAALFRPEPAVAEQMVAYGRWMFASVPAAVALAAFSGFFAGIGRPSWALGLNLALCALNAGLNWVLVFGKLGLPALGAAGAGIGTCIAFVAIAAVAFAIFVSAPMRRRFATTTAIGDGARWRRFWRFAGPQGVAAFVEIAAWSWFTVMVARLGTAPLAANNVVISWNLLTYLPMIGLGQAIGVVIGQAVGAGAPQLAARVARRGLALQMGYAVVIAVIVIAARDPLIDAFVDTAAHPDTRTLSRQLLVIAALWGFADGANLTWRNALGGAGDTRWAMRAIGVLTPTLMVGPTLIILLDGGRLAAALGMPQVTAMWTASLLFVTGCAAALGLRWRTGRWRAMSVRNADAGP